jgi:hypothetical protein
MSTIDERVFDALSGTDEVQLRHAPRRQRPPRRAVLNDPLAMQLATLIRYYPTFGYGACCAFPNTCAAVADLGLIYYP